MESSHDICQIATALARAQSEMKPATFDATNPHFKSRYASLSSVMEACRIALTGNGLALVQGARFNLDTESVEISTRLIHTSGQWLGDTLTLRPQKTDPQGIGSAISYGRRYGLAALLGIVADEDLDGELRETEPEPTSPRLVRPLRQKKDKTEGQRRRMDPNTRVGKIREIFDLSARLGQGPDEMKAEISRILNMDTPLESSENLNDDQVDQVLRVFRERAPGAA